MLSLAIIKFQINSSNQSLWMRKKTFKVQEKTFHFWLHVHMTGVYIQHSNYVFFSFLKNKLLLVVLASSGGAKVKYWF